eukprot:8875827-Alexandrium_andersonii.AAC.1
MLRSGMMILRVMRALILTKCMFMSSSTKYCILDAVIDVLARGLDAAARLTARACGSCSRGTAHGIHGTHPEPC